MLHQKKRSANQNLGEHVTTKEQKERADWLVQTTNRFKFSIGDAIEVERYAQFIVHKHKQTINALCRSSKKRIMENKHE